MRLILVRHGLAAAKSDDPQRPLTRTGRQQLARLALFLAGTGLEPVRIAHSGKLRAQQTAEMLAACFDRPPPLSIEPDLAPNAAPESLAQACADWHEDTILVGHLPHLARLAALLLLGNAAEELFHIQAATALFLVRKDGRMWVECMVPGSMLAAVDAD